MTIYVLFILFGYALFNSAVCLNSNAKNEVVNNEVANNEVVKHEVVQLNANNIDGILAEHELVFINFYVDWCRFSNLMQPVFDDAAKLVYQEHGKSKRAVMARVDCDHEVVIGKRFQISKYPTLKISLNGDIMKTEYRGQRSPEALADFVRQQLKDPIKEVINLNQLKDVSPKKRFVVAYFDRRDTGDYHIYRRVAANLKDFCDFYAGFGETVSDVQTGDRPTIVFRPDTEMSNQHEEVYSGNIHADELKIWAQERCIPLVREITFENAEELTEEGMPFMILFYHPNNTTPIKDYKARVEAELIHEKQNVNFLVADGKKFAHPLQHLERTLDDLPLIAIDSFRHMYIFPDYNDIFKPGKLKKFVDDLHSGKLHREFHYGPDASSEEHNTITTTEKPGAHPTEKPLSDNEIHDGDELPPDSTFIKLAPSENRYTILRNEL
ncbi:endoplasmic reticulum resident protein 44-like [Contarinia nasturtii]|uniref:endoplasmic reticulum resident protein 44-like n=1 Tax=Contarinia nasturtii TaxID=265458 RepID=UPI0012D3DD0A|nr:endoplasmic reticulum resident protein 44-like [Contarinia nasturtii]